MDTDNQKCVSCFNCVGYVVAVYCNDNYSRFVSIFFVIIIVIWCFSALEALLFRTKPAVPCISKWTTCGTACRYFTLTCGYHNLMYRAFVDMHKGSSENLECGKQESTEMVQAVEMIADAADQQNYRKALRIKSFKAFEWLQSEKTVYNLLTCVLISQALETIMWTFMAWQRESAWLTLESAPLIRMANSKSSPAVQAMKELSQLLRNASFDAVDFEELFRGRRSGTISVKR